MKANADTSRRLAPAIVLGMTETGLAVLRALGAAGISCWGLSVGDPAPAMRSRYCRRRFVLHSPASDEMVLEALESAAGSADGRCVLVPSEDRFVGMLSRRREELGRHFDLCLPEDGVVDTLLDKGRFAEFLTRGRFPMPASEPVSTADDLRRAAGVIGFPLVVKPSGMGRQGGPRFPKVQIVHSEPECAELVSRLAGGSGLSLIAQEFIPGGDRSHISVAVCLDRASRPIASFTTRKLRQTNVGNGVGTYVETTQEPEATRLATDVLRAARYVGVAEVEIKKDERSGALRLIEVNPRIWTQAGLASKCGVNFPAMLYTLARGEQPVAPDRVSSGRWQDLWDDFYWTFRRDGYRKRGLVSTGEWLKQTAAVTARSYASWKDPMPLLVRACRTAPGILRRKAQRG